MDKRRKDSRSATYYKGICYTTFGLKLHSPIQLPDLVETNNCDTPDVTIFFCDVNEKIENPTTDWGWMQCNSHECLINVQSIARFLVVEGRRIYVDRRVLKDPRMSGAPSQDLRVYLLGFVMCVLLYQRHQPPLHLFSLVTPRGTLALAGDTGAGKSTLGALLHLHFGWQVVSDDLGVLVPGAAKPLLSPGPARIKLHADALQALGINQQHLRQDQLCDQKYQLPPSPQALAPGTSVPLDMLVLLEWTEADKTPSLQRLQGLEAFQAVHQAFYWPQLASITGPTSPIVMRSVCDIAASTEIYRLRRPKAFHRLEESVNLLLQALSCDTATMCQKGIP